MDFKGSIPRGNQKADLIYKKTLQKDIYLTFLPPEKDVYEKAPVYFLIPGGGWHDEERESMFGFSETSLDALRKKGFAAVSIDYRVYKDEGVVIRDIVNDCFDAVRYIAHFADILKIDPQKIVVSGHSAGAHLALMLAYAPEEKFADDKLFDDSFKVISAAAICPPTILYETNPATSSLDLMRKGDTKAFGDNDTREERELVSPITYISKDCPPTIFCAGTSDRLVYCNSSELAYKKLKEQGVDCDLVLSLGGGHVFEQMHDNIVPKPSRDDIQKLATEFILKHL